MGRRCAKHDERGASLVEFVVSLPFLLVVTLGVVDVGRAYTATVQLANAAREGAMYAQTHPLAQVPGGPGCADPDNITYHALTENGVKRTDMTVTVSPAVGCVAPSSDQPLKPGDIITVTVSSPFAPITPLVEGITGLLTIKSSVSVVVQG